MMCRYVDYLKSKSDNHILSHGLGDWFDLGPKDPGPSQLTLKPVTATAIYYYDLVLLSEMAGILKKKRRKARLSDFLTKWSLSIPQPEQGNCSQNHDPDDASGDQDVRPGDCGGMRMTVRVDYGMAVGTRGEEGDGKQEADSKVCHIEVWFGDVVLMVSVSGRASG